MKAEDLLNQKGIKAKTDGDGTCVCIYIYNIYLHLRILSFSLDVYYLQTAVLGFPLHSACAASPPSQHVGHSRDKR